MAVKEIELEDLLDEGNMKYKYIIWTPNFYGRRKCWSTWRQDMEGRSYCTGLYTYG
jgi:hypothetical protein